MNATADIGEPIKVVSLGIIENSSWNWNPSDKIFLGNTGDHLSNLPPVSGVSLQIAQSVGQTKIFVNVRIPVEL